MTAKTTKKRIQMAALVLDGDRYNFKWFVKHLINEYTGKWWDLYEFNWWPSNLEVEELNVDQLKCIGALKFVKQFESEEELEVEVMVKYGGLGNFKMLEK